MSDTPSNAALQTGCKPNFLRRLYDWTISWADSPYAFAALAVLAFAESSFFPIPPDVLLIAMAFGAPKKWLRIALVCTLFSVIGGILGWLIGHLFWSAAGDFFFAYIPGFTHELFDEVSHFYQENAFLAIFGAAFTPIPYKIFTIAAGVCQVPIWILVLGSIVGRGGRFFLVAGIIRLVGPKAKPFLEKYFNSLALAFFVLLVAGFAALKYCVPHGEKQAAAPAAADAPAQVQTAEMPAHGAAQTQVQEK